MSARRTASAIGAARPSTRTDSSVAAMLCAGSASASTSASDGHAGRIDRHRCDGRTSNIGSG
ncbi:MAG TPA: hypothetical protein DDZ76_11585 [Xanthomonadales bacterium]|nr:hypothetical protein [Xanthomonadales bacterium]